MQICAAGALITVLQKQHVLLNAENDDVDLSNDAYYHISSIREVSLDGYLMVDAASLQALQVSASASLP